MNKNSEQNSNRDQSMIVTGTTFLIKLMINFLPTNQNHSSPKEYLEFFRVQLNNHFFKRY